MYQFKSINAFRNEHLYESKILEEKRSFRPQFGPQNIFFFEILALLDVRQSQATVPSYNLVQYQGKLMMQPWENGKNPNFGPNLPKKKPKKTPLLGVRQRPNYHPMQCPQKLSKPTWKNGTKPNLAQLWAPIFLRFYLYW